MGCIWVAWKELRGCGKNTAFCRFIIYHLPIIIIKMRAKYRQISIHLSIDVYNLCHLCIQAESNVNKLEYLNTLIVPVTHINEAISTRSDTV